jgi:hypothetical protein
MGLEPYEAFKNLKFYSERTVIILNTHPLDSSFSQLTLKKKVLIPSIGCILDILDQLVRRVIAIDLYDLSTTLFQSENYVPVLILGLAIKEFKDLFNKKRLINIIDKMLPQPSRYIEAFQYGYDLIDY